MPPPIVQAPFVGSDGRPLIEPGSFYIDGNYALRVNSWNSLAGVVVTIRARIIRATDGELVDSEWMHTPNSNRTKATNDFPLPAGFLLNLTVFASTGAPLVGQTFVQVQLSRGLSGATLLVATMLQDYITAAQALAYPGSPIRSSTDGEPFVRIVTGTTPGAGLDISEVVPTGARWELMALGAQLVPSAAVANRIPALRFRSGGLSLGVGLNATGVAASINGNFFFGPGYTGASFPSFNWFTAATPIGLRLLAATIIETLTSGIQAADQWGAPGYTVREWLEAAS